MSFPSCSYLAVMYRVLIHLVTPFLTSQQHLKLQPQLAWRAALNAESTGCPMAV